MSLNAAPSAERIHIAFFGLRNVGKSSLVNAVTGQELSLVSDIKGTTTDPVKKAMELPPLGPVVIIDTPGMDDEGTLGEMRVKRARQILGQTDIAVLVVDAAKYGAMGTSIEKSDIGEKKTNLHPIEQELLNLFKERKLPYLVVFNKADLISEEPKGVNTGRVAAKTRLPEDGAGSRASFSEDSAESKDKFFGDNAEGRNTNSDNLNSSPNSISLFVSAKTGENIQELKNVLATFAKQWEHRRRPLVSDLLSPGELAVLVIPIDESAPKGRLILPQQQVLRDILDAHCRASVCQPEELKETFAMLSVKPGLVITDSQAFGRVMKDVPPEIPLTSFSILFARYKGNLPALIRGADMLSKLKDGDQVLISEGCTHHRQCNDIGTVKIPGWIEAFSGTKPEFSFTSGGDFPEDLSKFRLIVHCGGCMLNETEMQRRMKEAETAGVPMVNYGVAIAHMNGILRRSLEPFRDQIEM